MAKSWTPAQAAREWGVTPRHVRLWIKRKRIRARRMGGRWYITPQPRPVDRRRKENRT